MHSTFKTALALLVTTGALKTWTAGENISPTDLNANFNHIHSKMVGGHGARLVNADVHSAAAISYTKLALTGSEEIVRNYATIASGCTGTGPCTLNSPWPGSGFSAAIASSIITVTYTNGFNPQGGVVVLTGVSTTNSVNCKLGTTTATTFTIRCTQHNTEANCDTNGTTTNCDNALMTTYPEIKFIAYSR